MHALDLILYALAAFCFFLSAFATPHVPDRINLVALGLFFWVLVPLITLAQG